MKKKYKVSIRTIFLIIPGIILVIMLSVSLIALKQKSIPLSSGKAGQESSVIKPAMAMGPSQKARGYRNASFALTGGSTQKIPIDTESYDPSDILDTSTGRITPTMPGYYQVVGQASISNVYVGRAYGAILKNSSEVSRGVDFTVLPGSGFAWPTLPVSDLIYFNGTGDYVELGAYVSANADVQASWVQLNYLSIVGPF